MATDLGDHVVVVYSPQARVVREVQCVLGQGISTVADALHHSGILAGMSKAEMNSLECGIWGRKVSLHHVLRPGDRIELYRPLLVDPKVARRERFVRQGAKSAGLFAKRRTGAKAGY